MAVSDYFDLQELYHNLRLKSNKPLSNEDDTNEPLSGGSQMRVIEMRIALLENEIRYNQSRIAGYSEAYTHISAGFEDLAMITLDEAGRSFPLGSEEQLKQSKNAYDEFFSEAQSIIFSKSG